MEAIYNESGQVQARYVYDAWGKVVSILDANNNQITDTNHIGHINPIRYRGYYYDTETSFYYLQSRYYDPEVGRFINLDPIIGQTGNVKSYNMYAYSFNNPIIFSDETGNFPGLALIPLAKAFATAVAVIATTYAVQKSITIASSVNSKKTTSNVKTNTLAIASSKTKYSEEIYTVYALVDLDEQVQYVGRTENVPARMAAHKANPARKDLEFHILHENLNYYQARGLEQAYMLHYHTINKGNPMNNQINGISLNNDNKTIYIKAVQKFARYIENQVTNELLNWANL